MTSSGLGALREPLLSFGRSPRSLPLGSILMFHSIEESARRCRIPMNRDLEVTPEFLEQVILLCRRMGREIISLDELIRRHRSGERVERFVCFTFDDGYKDNLLLAAPIFRKHQVPWTVYICTSFPDGTAVLWWYLLEHLVDRREELVVDDGGETLTYDLRTTARKDEAFYALRERLILAAPERRVKLLDEILVKNGFDPVSFIRDKALNWDEVRELSRDPLVTIGCHTINHYSMRSLNEADLHREIHGSKQVLEREIGRPVEHFCYPYGSPDAASEREFFAVESAGFLTATTTVMRNVEDVDLRNLCSLPRIPVRGGYEDPALLEIMMSGVEPGQLFMISDHIAHLQAAATGPRIFAPASWRARLKNRLRPLWHTLRR